MPPQREVSAVQPLDNRPPRAIATGELLPPRATANGTLRLLQESALVRFSEKGYHGVSTRELAQDAGVRVSTVYGHINTKEELLLELMQISHAEHNEWLRTALLKSDPDPVEQMRALVSAHVAMHATYPLLARMANKELHALSPENALKVMEVRHESERMFVTTVERGIASGQFRCSEPWLAVAAIGGMGIRVAEWFEPGGQYSVSQVADIYAEFALKLLA